MEEGRTLVHREVSAPGSLAVSPECKLDMALPSQEGTVGLAVLVFQSHLLCSEQQPLDP